MALRECAQFDEPLVEVGDALQPCGDVPDGARDRLLGLGPLGPPAPA